MAKKFGKFLLFSAAVGAAAAAAYYYMKKDTSIPDDTEDEDYDDFSEDLEDDSDTSRSYVAIPMESQETAAATEVSNETIAEVVEKESLISADTPSNTVEFFDADEEEDEADPTIEKFFDEDED